MRSRKLHFRLWTLLSVALIALAVAPQAIAQTGDTRGFRVVATPRIESVYHSNKQESATSTPATSGGLVSVIVKLAVKPLTSYDGGVQGLAPTSPSATGQQLDPASAESRNYLQYLDRVQKDFAAQATAAIPQARVTQRYDFVYGGAAMLVPEDQIAVLAKVPGVVGVVRDELRQLDTDVSPQFIGAPTLWGRLGGQKFAGEGVIVGVLDSGVWPEHPSFSDPDPSGRAYAAPPPPPVGTRACEFSGGAKPGPAFSCNNKLIGADRFMAAYDASADLLPDEFTSARDDNGHGTHTASTAAGNRNVKATVLGNPLGTVSGIAPRAHVMVYKVCGDLGCVTSDSVAAIQKAIQDGVDVINFSISGGSNPYTDPVEVAFHNAYDVGVFIAASAGNDGPGPETVAHRGPWVTTVAASTSNRQFLSEVTLRAAGGAQLKLTGASVTDGIDAQTPVVNAADAPYNDPLCQVSTRDGAFAGKIVVCRRGVNTRVAKGYNVEQRGAVGMLLYNPALQGLATDNHWLPAVHLENDAGASLLAFMAAQEGETASFTAGKARSAQGDVMAAFSSRGGPEQSLGISKPDVTAPGVQILAGHTAAPATPDGGPPGELFQAIQGTSMSSPHVAGAAALLADLRPSWTPGQIKSALMTTARTANLVKEDGETKVTPFDAGSGRIDLNRAGNPGITFDVKGGEYLALANELWNANYPSVYIPTMPGRVTVQRTARSVLNFNATWQLKVEAPRDLKIQVPRSIQIPAGGEATFSIALDASAVPLGETRHATLLLTREHLQARMPITIVRRQAALALEKTCEPTTIALSQETSCTISATNTTFEDAAVNIVDQLPSQLKLDPASVEGATAATGNRVVFNGMLAASEPPDVAIGPGETPAGGYLPLSAFGVDPFPGVSDEEIINLDVPAFTFAGETWETIGMTSNGYAVVGGGTGADVEYLNQSLPDPTRPNNVLAPFWTDLDPSAGGALRAGVLTDGTNNWIVLEWEAVKEFTTTKVDSFQIWIGSAANAGSADDISYAFGPIGGNGDGGLLTVGAENKFGNRGEMVYYNGTGTLPANGTELRVTTTAGEPGETHEITFDAIGNRTGAWTNCAELRSSAIAGVSTACVSGTVTR